jgi:substrate-binding family protein
MGDIMPYSGPVSAYGVIGKTEQAYLNRIDAEGGINGRKINFISYDDGYSPPKTVEQARKFEAAQIIITSAYIKDPTEPQWKDDPGMKAFNALLTSTMRRPTARTPSWSTATQLHRPWCMC